MKGVLIPDCVDHFCFEVWMWSLHTLLNWNKTNLRVGFLCELQYKLCMVAVRLIQMMCNIVRNMIVCGELFGILWVVLFLSVKLNFFGSRLHKLSLQSRIKVTFGNHLINNLLSHSSVCGPFSSDNALNLSIFCSVYGVLSRDGSCLPFIICLLQWTDSTPRRENITPCDLVLRIEVGIDMLNEIGNLLLGRSRIVRDATFGIGRSHQSVSLPRKHEKHSLVSRFRDEESIVGLGSCILSIQYNVCTTCSDKHLFRLFGVHLSHFISKCTCRNENLLGPNLDALSGLLILEDSTIGTSVRVVNHIHNSGVIENVSTIENCSLCNGQVQPRIVHLSVKVAYCTHNLLSELVRFR
mmetsp:Transcript_8513/g.31488  ORF Transcript_8513/g.31488 Transcript_8513/m.31488 type:complete len:353 (+) Transcript_8513:267-1325(+)